jgi:quercetin dioxygenase-like cupin family protein
VTIIPSQLPGGVLRAGEGERHDQLGTTFIFKTHSEETGGAVFMWQNLTPPGTMVPPHIHQTEDEFIYVVEGELEVTLGATTHTARAGDLVKMPRGVPHAVRSAGATVTKSLWTVVPAGKMEAFFRALLALPTDPPPQPETIARLFAEHNLVLLPPPGA